MPKLKRTKEQIALDIKEQHKNCCVCNERKHFSEFYNLVNKNDGKSYRCKTCDSVARASWYEKHPERSKASARARSLKFKYGLTIEEYTQLSEKQNHKCAICGCDENSSKVHGNFAVDHCHHTNEVRGLLCNQCNRAIGMLDDDPLTVFKAYQYLSGEWCECH